MTTVKKSLIFMVIAMTSLLSGCEQERVDEQMQELCDKDGGIKIYEKVELPKEKFTENGDLTFFVTYNVSSGGYYFETKDEKLRENSPTLTRYTYTITRESDKKILGTYVYYLRIGGAIFPRLGPDPAKQCPSNLSDRIFKRAIFFPSK